MAYAKPCKYCGTTQVIWDEKLDGPNKFKEVKSNLQHSRERCDAAKKQKETDFVEGRGYMERPHPDTYSGTAPLPREQQELVKTTSQSLETAAIIERLDKISLMVKAIGARQELQLEGDSDKRDRMQLLQKIAELEDALKQKGLVVSAKDYKPDSRWDPVDAAKKGQANEEFEDS